MNNISIDVIIVNFNSTNYTIRCIGSVKRNIKIDRIKFIVVDNNSDDSPEKISECYPEVHLIRNSLNMGFGKAINIALKLTTSKYILLLNPDTEIRDRSFSNIFEYIEKNPKVSVAGPMVLDRDGSLQGSARKFPTVWTSIFGRKSPLTKLFPNNPITKREFVCFDCDDKSAIDVDWVSGACMIIRREVIRKIGGFDERFFLYWEDTDLCKRLKDAGWRAVYYPKVRIFHSVGKSSEKTALRSIFHFHRSCFLLFVKHSKASMSLLIPFALAGLAARCLFVMAINVMNRAFLKFACHKITSNKKRGSHSNRFCSKACVDNGKRKILFINQYFPPDRSATAGVLERIVEYLSDSYYCTVLAGRPSYLSLEKHDWKPIYFYKNDKARIAHVGSFTYPRKNHLFRSINYLSYFLIALMIATLIRTDLIITMTDPPIAGIIGAIVSFVKKKPFIYYIQDMHPEMAIASGMLRAGFVTKIWDILHISVLRKADRILVLGDDMYDRIEKKGIPASKIAVIRHGASKYKEDECTDENLIKKIRGTYRFVFMHAGNIGYYGSWDSIIGAFEKIHNSDIGFIFVGEGQNKKNIMSRCQTCSNIEFIPYQPEEKVQSVLSAADVHIITIKKGLEGLIVPSKIYPILSAKKPILAVCSEKNDIARVIKRFNCGKVVDPDSPQKIIEAVYHFVKNKEKLPIYCENSKRAAEFFNQKGQLNILKNEIKKTLCI